MDDSYLEIIDEHWDKIMMIYELFTDKQPVMLFELPSLKIYAYPYKEYKASLTQRSQALLTQQYQEAQAKGQIVLFVRDNTSEDVLLGIGGGVGGHARLSAVHPMVL